MNSKLIESIANAVLYEGYMLYPYRASAVKNRQRWNFGVLYPQAYSELQNGADVWSTQTQCLIRGSETSIVDVKVRFLQCVMRQIGQPAAPLADFRAGSEPELKMVESLEVGDKRLQSWQEAIERDAIISSVRLADLLHGAVPKVFSFPGCRELEPLRDREGAFAAFVVRTRQDVTARVEISAARRADDLFQLTVIVANAVRMEAAQNLRREDALMSSLLSAHTVLSVTRGEFVSLMDPPADAREFASQCENIKTWPVLVGEENVRDAMLSSPIILYDYPQVAPESPGDLFDGTEIDEILALRILTLSDEEKREVRQGDDRAREILERTESMPAEHFMKLHGVLRGMKRANDARAGSAEDER
jgi:hypothetical protein